jgi:IMP dehydrogenase
MIEGLSFDDVLLEPKHGILDRRADADISTELVSGVRMDIPILSANMPSVTGVSMAVAMYESGGRGILHRFNTIEEQVADYIEIRRAYANAPCSIGLHDWLERATALAEEGCNIFVLDVAHGDTERVLHMMDVWRPFADESLKLIVGNVATLEAAGRLIRAGADGLKVGIGPGAACTTREVTGFGVPQLTAINNVAASKFMINPEIKIIADGGIKNSGDIVKALAMGADSVMVGRLLAGTDESPNPGEYYGNASYKVNGHNAPEGVSGEVEKSGSVKEVLKNLTWGIKSGISYGGAANIKELQDSATFIRVSPLTVHESGARI